MDLFGLIWLLSVIENIDASFGFLLALSSFTFLGSGLAWLVSLYDSKAQYRPDRAASEALVPKFKALCKSSALVFLLLFPVNLLTPGKERINMLAAAYIADAVLEAPGTAEEAKALPLNLLKGANESLKAIIRTAEGVAAGQVTDVVERLMPGAVE